MSEKLMSATVQALLDAAGRAQRERKIPAGGENVEQEIPTMITLPFVQEISVSKKRGGKALHTLPPVLVLNFSRFFPKFLVERSGYCVRKMSALDRVSSFQEIKEGQPRSLGMLDFCSIRNIGTFSPTPRLHE